MSNKPRTTMYDVAKAVGVSGPAVSVVLNNRLGSTIKVSPETRARILRAAEELNYTPSLLGRGLSEQKSYAIGLLLSEINAPLVADVIRGVQDVSNEQRYSPMVFIHGDSKEETTEFERSMDRQVDALIVDTFDAPADPASVERYRKMSQAGFPLVELFGNSIPDVPRVNVDFMGDGRRSVERLVSLGHQRIALVVHDQYQKRIEHWAAWGFFSGYRAAMTEAGLKASIITAPAITTPGDSQPFIESGRHAARELIKLKDRPTAVICYGNRRAFGLVKGLQYAAWNIPEDISVMGYYEREPAELTEPPLTSLVVAARRAGQQAAQAAFALMEGKSGVTAAVASDWIEGRSVAPYSLEVHSASRI
ncbi:MAG: LacI family transcriptional regulator [Planctomycetes bacterium]|nr:LacI family transcriptional regulator [Planctomycetota bacterium]